MAEQIYPVVRSLNVHIKSCTLLIIHSPITLIWWNVVFENLIFLTFLSSSTLLLVFFLPSLFPVSLAHSEECSMSALGQFVQKASLTILDSLFSGPP